MYQLEIPEWAKDTAAVAQKAAEVHVEPFKPSDKVKIETDPNAKGPPVDSGMAADDETRIQELAAQLDGIRGKLPGGYKLAPIAFEKDDDTNYHMDLITALANNRARNYSIPEVCIRLSRGLNTL